MKVITIKKWVNEEISPMVWQRIVIKLLPVFREEGHYIHTIKDDSELSDLLIKKIDETIWELYKKRIPNTNVIN